MAVEVTGAAAAAATTAQALSISLGTIADLITITQYLFSTVEPEVHKIYEYTYDTRQNLIKLMDAIEGADYKKEVPKEVQNKFEEHKETINKGIKDFDRYLKDTNYVENLAKNTALYHEAKIEIIRQIIDFFIKERANIIKQLHEEYPFTYPLAPSSKIEDGQKTEETDLAAADTGQLVALIQQLGEKIDLVSASFGTSGVVSANFAAGEDGSSILNRLVAIDEKLNVFTVQNIEAQAETIALKIVEKTGGAESPEEKVTVEQVAEMISVETEKQPEQYQEIIKLLGQNQNIMYGYQDQLSRLEHMIQTKALSFDQIYRKIVKRMWDDYKCGG